MSIIMKLLRPKKRTIRPRIKSLIKFRRDGVHCYIMVEGLILNDVGVYENDDIATRACWRVMGSM